MDVEMFLTIEPLVCDSQMVSVGFIFMYYQCRTIKKKKNSCTCYIFCSRESVQTPRGRVNVQDNITKDNI